MVVFSPAYFIALSNRFQKMLSSSCLLPLMTMPAGRLFMKVMFRALSPCSMSCDRSATIRETLTSSISNISDASVMRVSMEMSCSNAFNRFAWPYERTMNWCFISSVTSGFSKMVSMYPSIPDTGVLSSCAMFSVILLRIWLCISFCSSLMRASMRRAYRYSNIASKTSMSSEKSSRFQSTCSYIGSILRRS